MPEQVETPKVRQNQPRVSCQLRRRLCVAPACSSTTTWLTSANRVRNGKAISTTTATITAVNTGILALVLLASAKSSEPNKQPKINATGIPISIPCSSADENSAQ